MTYVMSDIHGNMRRFRSVMEQIDLQPDDMLYVLGDVIDRHPDGIAVLQELMSMSNVKILLGNHEYMMLDVVDQKKDTCDDIDFADSYERFGDVQGPIDEIITEKSNEEV